MHSTTRPIALSRGHLAAALTSFLAGAWLLTPAPLAAEQAGAPFATLVPAVSTGFPNETDSNSPAVWDLVDGTWTLSVFNSVAGRAALSDGPSVRRLVSRGAVRFDGAPPEQGVWFESVIREADAWYGYYHNERANVVCPGSGKVWPRIGAARSEDRGVTWVDLGPILETPAASVVCASTNHYFVGAGVGDFTVRLDPDREFAYIYYSQYAETERQVGVAAARMAWADRDAPEGRIDVWVDGVWMPAERALADGREGDDATDEGVEPPPDRWVYPVATPFFRSANSWDDQRAGVDAFWGPSIHWNTEIQTWVMLLNQAVGPRFEQGGIWVSFNDRLDNPAGWSAPVQLLKGGQWYPQVIGLDPTLGTDALASGLSRFFMAGRSDHYIVFGRR